MNLRPGQVLRGGSPVDFDLRERLDELANHLDDEYLVLDGRADSATRASALRLFSQARAASALACALVADTEQLHEAIYEAIVSVADGVGIVREIEAVLR